MSHTQHRYTITTSTLDDVEPMAQMHAQSWLDSYPNEKAGVPLGWVQTRVAAWLTSEGLTKRATKLKESNSEVDKFLRVARGADGKIIGLISGQRREDAYRLNALYVDKEYHGTGVAQALMKEYLEWTKPELSVDLEVVIYNDRAKAFYGKYGFKEIENSEHTVHEILPVTTMVRKGDKQ